MSYLDCYVANPLVERNTFRSLVPQQDDLPRLECVRDLLPEPVWPANPAAIACYWKSWELAFAHLRQPTEANGFVANYIDPAFNDHLFLWDSVFILMFGRYGRAGFDFQRTLDNLYAKQHKDGFISRQIRESDGCDHFHRHDPVSTGPNVLPWSEWEYFLEFSDRDRLARVLPVLQAYHQWMRTHRTWPDGSYWSTGWGCGMDNQPRQDRGYSRSHHHGWLTWIDACWQQVLSARLLAEMARTLGQPDEAEEFHREGECLCQLVNDSMWNPSLGFYVDRRRDGTLSDVRTIGAYWGLLAGAVPRDRLDTFIAPLKDDRLFRRLHRVPSLSADHEDYDPAGGYWRGAVWPPTNYMVLKGLTHVGQDELAYDIARNHLDNVVEVFRDTGTIWENYAPDAEEPGKPARKDFVGWGGLGPIAVLLEYVLGLRPHVRSNRLLWDIRLTQEHGVRRYPFGCKGMLNLHCLPRDHPSDRPMVQASSTVPVLLEIRWLGGRQELGVGG